MISRRTFMRGAIATGVGAGLATYMNGESRFHQLSAGAPMATPDDLAQAQGVVVFTGSKGRIEEALRICRSHQKLHVTGCGPEMTVPKLLKAFPVKNMEVDPANISLDYARNTLENGHGTRDWLKQNGAIDKMIVVTSDFHLPRAFSLLQTALSDLDRRVDFSFRPVNSEQPWYVALKERFKLSAESPQRWLHNFSAPAP